VPTPKEARITTPDELSLCLLCNRDEVGHMLCTIDVYKVSSLDGISARMLRSR